MSRISGSQVNEANIVDFVSQCIRDNDMYPFYRCPAWIGLRKEVLEEFHNECQPCKDKGIYTRAADVHHVNPVKHYPELALSKFFTDINGNRQRQLVPVCDGCHFVEHKKMKAKSKKGYINSERWD